MKKLSKILISLVIIFVVFIISMYIYFNDYYKADNMVVSVLKNSDDVQITENDYGYYFNGKGKNVAIIFYPGAKVEYTAYSSLMRDISSSGVDCFLIKMPFNFALLNYNVADEIIDNYDYDEWYLAGHSLGGVAASMYVNNHLEKVNGIIFLASYSTKKIDENIKILSIYGDRDNVLNKKSYNKEKSNWNSTFSEVVINGGNHSGFGNYGEQKGDNKALISKNSQQKETTEAIINFVKG